MKRILTVQDISCVGKCSLTVALPVISAFGVECAVLPTAVLSAHTAFAGFTFRDLTEDIGTIARHWEEQGIRFDTLYTGYLASFRQLELVESLIARFGSGTVLVDPVMADNGSLYTGFTPDFARAMAGLCGHADIILPNLTEACFLLGIPYPGDDYDDDFIRTVLRALAGLGCKTAVIKGVATRPGKLGIVSYTPATDRFSSYFHERLPARFHGTGDIFASCVCGALTQGRPAEEALRIAADFTVASIQATLADSGHNWYGVNFEAALPQLIDRLRA